MIFLFVFIYILTLERIFVDSAQSTNLLEERLDKLERKGMEQQAIIQKLIVDMEEYKLETKAQAEMIHDLSMKLERQTEHLILKEMEVSELESRLNKILDRQHSTEENFKNISGDSFDQSSRNKVKTMNDDKINEDKNKTTNLEKTSVRQRRLQLPVSTQCHPSKMNVAFRVRKSVNSSGLVHDFDEVDLNFGGSFNTSSGNFIAPTSGLYLFTLSVTASSIKTHINMFASVYVNNLIVDRIILEEPNSDIQHRSATVIAKVKAGEIVFVSGLINSADNFTNVKFSGVLISQM